MTKHHKDSSIHNGVLRCCNQFPRHYANINEMTAQLDEIASLGFNAVWMNPVHQTGRHRKQGQNKCGSLYAIADYWQVDPAFSVVPRKASGKPADDSSLEDAFEQDRRALRAYTDTARSKNLIPIFDLVPVHAAVDSPLVTGTHPRFKGRVDTSRWFRRHDNGQLMIYGMDDQGKASGDKVWDDVAQFKYEDPVIAREIFEYLWKPYISMCIGKEKGQFGFQGVRIDALANAPHEILKKIIDYAADRCREVHHKEPIILGETLGAHIDGFDRLHDLGITHVTNLAYWVPTQHGPNISIEKATDHRRAWQNGGAWFADNMGLQQQIVHFRHGKPVPVRKGGTVGFPGFHDGVPWSRQLLRSGIKDQVDVERGMREKMALAAFISDAGWFVLGSDLDADARVCNVFEDHNNPPPRPQCNMRPFVKEVNAVLAKQPVTQFGTWPERFFDDDHPDLMIIRRNIGYGNGEQSTIVLVNLDPQKEMALDRNDMVKVARLTRRPVTDFATPSEHGIFCCGGVKLVQEKKSDHLPGPGSGSATGVSR